MKNNILFALSLSLAVFAAGCDKEQSTSQQIDKVNAETKETAQDMKDYTFAQKAEFTEKMRAQWAAINSDFDQLQARIDKSSDAVKADAKPKLHALRDQADQLKKHIDASGDATESTWDNVKSSTRKAYDSLKDGFNQSRQWVSDKIAP